MRRSVEVLHLWRKGVHSIREPKASEERKRKKDTKMKWRRVGKIARK